MNNKFLVLMISAMFVLGACSTVSQNPVGQNPEGNNGNNGQIAKETPDQANSGEQVMCTMDAKMCEDGSYVGRTGPNCEFAACPGEGSGLTIKEVPQVSRIMSPEIVFKAYMEENISKVSKKNPVLGGNWVITNIENTGEGTAVVDYEDGHITGKMNVTYEIVDDKVVVKEVVELEE
ncbi:MAG: hypothetical protein ACRCZE_02560 [Candidatus Altimarinota bacterium]